MEVENPFYLRYFLKTFHSKTSGLKIDDVGHVGMTSGEFHVRTSKTLMTYDVLTSVVAFCIATAIFPVII